MKLIVIESATGNVVGQWEGGDDPPALPDGRQYILAEGLEGSVAGKRWDGDFSVFVDREPDPEPVIREIDTVDFMDRFTEEEELAFEAITEESNPAGRAMRMLFRRLTTRQTVRLDNPRLVSGMNRLKLIGLQRGIWPDEAWADVRIAEILS